MATLPLQTTLELGVLAAADDVEHCFSFAARTLISCGKTSLFRAGFAVALVSCGDGAGNTVEENSSVFCLIQML